ncbi:ech hydrogenase subunit E [Desulfurobacterium pacificum]|uniref:Ech hydrogenase subunit E n=1 Tax=Desulfurobacterium pacificum TaxID=240166 RepID=A0ABY1N8H8_9BACT|nr:nickel-dependent hydrogenase large subunit [Desulfurobacterium pacificum]SMP03300.1 ech hydrogenase subunit E [Desulfurobacterium pacificum]
MGNRITIPFGSQHVALPEPVRFVFQTENERIIDVDVDVGYVHRGIEKACMTKFKYLQVGYVVARVCGLCAISHTLGYVTAIERMMGIEVPRKALYLRLLVSELDRVHSHLLAMGHTAEVAGYENLFMQTFKHRELVMELQELVTGNRIQFDYVTVGGVNRELTAEEEKVLREKLKLLEEKCRWLKDVFENDYTVKFRWKGTGVITPEMAKELNVVGPPARASNLPTDARAEYDYLPFEEVGYRMVVRTEGDIYARTLVRAEETLNSIEMLWNILDGMPEGDIKVDVKGLPEGESIARIEAPRGELFYYVKASKKIILDRLRIRVPTFANIPVMKELFIGMDYADVPATVISFDPCLSCTAR